MYQQSLVSLQKRLRPRCNLPVGNIVMLGDDSLPRNCWKLSRFEEPYPDDDGLIRKVRIGVCADRLDSGGKKPVVYFERLTPRSQWVKEDS